MSLFRPHFSSPAGRQRVGVAAFIIAMLGVVASVTWQVVVRLPLSPAVGLLSLAWGVLLATLVAVWAAMAHRHGIRAAGPPTIPTGPLDRGGSSRSLQRLQAVLDLNPAFVDVKDVDGCYILANRPFNEKFAPAGRSSVVGLTPEDIFPAEMAAVQRQHHARVVAKEVPIVQEQTTVERHGVHTYLTRKFPLRNAAGRIDSVCCFAVDITDQKQIEARLQEHADLLNQASDAILGLDLEDRITFWNHAAQRLFGWSAEEALGRSVAEILVNAPSGQFVRIRHALLTDAEWRGELPHTGAQGRHHDIELRAALLRDRRGEARGCILTCTDVTEKKLLNEQLLRAQRLEGIGMLAAGIAHDLNNIFAPIRLGAGILRTRLQTGAEARLLDTFDSCAQRGADLIQQMLGFTHGVSGGTRLVQIHHLLCDIALIVQETFPRSITLEENVSRDLPPVDCNPTQIHQILLNLCVNARDAMPDGGTLILRAHSREIDASTAAQLEGAAPGRWVVLEVGDNGTGIPPNVLPRIWEPFYTTKGLKGTGLGLATVKGIVASHHGFIQLDTQEGKGTTFRVFLPAAEREVAAGPVENTAAAAAG
jgi:PAS domain S-box-containing protein